MNLSPRHRRRNQAFTLIELMVVIVLIGIMSAVIIPQMGGTFSDAKLRSAGRGLIEAAQLASSQAIAQNRPHRLRLDLKESRYVLERKGRGREEGAGFAPTDGLPGDRGSWDSALTVQVLDLEQTLDAEATLEPAPPEAKPEPTEGEAPPAPPETILFYPDGTADPRKIVLKDKEGFGLVLRFNPVTSRVKVEDLERN